MKSNTNKIALAASLALSVLTMTFGANAIAAEWQHVTLRGSNGTGYNISIDYVGGEDTTWTGGEQRTVAAWINVTLNVNSCEASAGTMEATIYGDFADMQLNVILTRAESSPCRFTAEIPEGLKVKYFTGGRGGVVRYPRYTLVLKSLIQGTTPGWIRNNNSAEGILFNFQLQ